MTDHFTLVVDLPAFTPGDVREGVIVAVQPDPDVYPEAGVGVRLGGDTKRTDDEGHVDFDLVSLTGLQYVVRIGGDVVRRISGEQDNASTVRLDEEIPVVPAPISTIDAAALRAEVLELLEGFEPLPGGGALTVTSGVVDLDNTLSVGTLLGFRLTATSTVEGVELAAGTYVFERDSGYPSGWNYRTVAPASGLPVPDGGGDPDPEEPTETTPQEPLWDDALLQVTFSDIVGVQYTYNGSPVAAGVYSMSPGVTVTASAAPKTGYVFPGGVATSWNHNVPASEDWTPAFTDALTTPTGEVTTRTQWTINNPNADPYDHISISSAGMTVTGTANAQVSPLINGTKHAVEFDYALPVGSYNSTGGGFEIYVAFNDWGGHTIKVYPNDGVNQGASVVFSGTTGWTGAVGEVGVNLNAQPLVGHIRAEFDGTYVRFLIDDVLILNALPDPNNNPGFGGAARFCSVRLSGAPNTTDIRRIKNLVVETK